MFGILNLNKSAGWTSRDAVNRVQRLVRPHKVGHAGTLDPLATGVLVVCLGPATRLIDYVQQRDKEYHAAFLLGRTSASADVDTEVTELAAAPRPTPAQIESALVKFTGLIEQVPPAFSAVKVAGQRAYTLARQGKDVAITARPVNIHSLEITDYAYPRLALRICCGSGTYVRSLGRDLARDLGTDAVMNELTRTRIGDFTLADAVSVEDLTAELLAHNMKPALMAASHLPTLVLSPDDVAELRFGRSLHCSGSTECAGVDDKGNLVAILRPTSPGILKPHINFASSL